MKKTYKYCTVVPKFRENDFYYYLDYSGKIKKGTCVIAPFGDDEIIGKVTEVGYYEEGNVPWPIVEMKSIHRIIEKKEYDEYTYTEYLGEDESNKYELFEGDRVCIRKECLIGNIVDKIWSEYCHEYMYKVEPEKNKKNWHYTSYSCYELEKVEIIGKVRYIRNDVNEGVFLGKTYEVFGVEHIDVPTLRVVDNGTEAIYRWTLRGTFEWEIVEDIDGKLSYALENPECGLKSVRGDD